MFRKLLILALALALCLPAATVLAEVDACNTVTALGTATVTVQPDAATLTVGVTTQDTLVTVAQTANATAMQSVLQALRDGGIADADLQTQNYSVNPIYDYQNGKFSNAQTVSGYEVSNNVQVTVRALDQLPTLLDAAMAAGANQSYGITFISEKSADAYDQAMAAAAADAVRKAKLLAAASGRMPGQVQSLTEATDAYIPFATGKAVTYDAMDSTPIENGTLTVTANVRAVLALE